tara:strand:+ start:321 stop:515 length:195 start_codon:yes stop_codon:yes gene_type:complete
MEVENPDAKLLYYMNSLSRKELMELIKHSNLILKNAIEKKENILMEENKTNQKKRSLCQILFDY